MRRLSKQTKRNMISYLLTFFLYLPLILWWSIYSSMLIASPSETKTKEISLDLNSFQDNRPEPIQEDIEATEKEIKREVIPKESVATPKPKPTPMVTSAPKPIIKKVVKKRPIDIPKSKRVDKKKRKIKKSKSKQKIQKHSRSRSRNRDKSRNISKKRGKSTIKSNNIGKSKFIKNLKLKIERNKKYPRIAQKRGMQGSVRVKFTITRAGTPSNIVTRGPKVFSSATKSAIKRSFPISTKGVSLPINITLTINYHLKR